MLRGVYHKKEKKDVSLLSPFGKQNRPKDDLKIIEQIQLFYFDKKVNLYVTHWKLHLPDSDLFLLVWKNFFPSYLKCRALSVYARRPLG